MKTIPKFKIEIVKEKQETKKEPEKEDLLPPGEKPKTIDKANIELLKRLIWHPKLLKIMCTEENLTKLKGLIEQRIEFKDQTGKTFIKASKIGKTTKETVEELKKTFTKGMHQEITKNYPITHKLHEKGYKNATQESTGGIKTIKITTILRKTSTEWTYAYHAAKHCMEQQTFYATNAEKE